MNGVTTTGTARFMVLAASDAAALGAKMLPTVPCLIGAATSRTAASTTLVSVLCVPVLNKF